MHATSYNARTDLLDVSRTCPTRKVELASGCFLHASTQMFNNYSNFDTIVKNQKLYSTVFHPICSLSTVGGEVTVLLVHGF